MTIGQRGRPRDNTVERREAELIDTAFGLFCRRGYHAVSLAMVAAQAHVAVRTIYSKFGGKAGLLQAIVEREHARHRSELHALEKPEPLAERLRVLATHLMVRSRDPAFRALQPLVISEGGAALARACYQAGPGQFVDLLTEELALAQKAGGIACDDPADALAALFIDLVKGEELARFFADGQPDGGRVAQLRPVRLALFLSLVRIAPAPQQR